MVSYHKKSNIHSSFQKNYNVTLSNISCFSQFFSASSQRNKMVRFLKILFKSKEAKMQIQRISICIGQTKQNFLWQVVLRKNFSCPFPDCSHMSKSNDHQIQKSCKKLQFYPKIICILDCIRVLQQHRIVLHFIHTLGANLR